jgi:hypothetical protein
MGPLRTKKKRSPGRPKENKLIRELKVKTWFAAVAKASGKTAYELEKEFAPSYVDREEFGKHRARLWDKYRLGKTMPTMVKTESGRRPVALLVEEVYPGTIKWLESPIWELLDLDIELSMNDIRSIYESLDLRIAELIIDDKKGQLFWRKQEPDPSKLIVELHRTGTIDSLTALVCLWRESILCQQSLLHMLILRHLRTSVAGFPQTIVKALQKLY